MGRKIGKLRKAVAETSDYRVRLLSEVLAGIQVIKMYTWEKPFEKLVSKIRNSEISAITKTLYCQVMFSSFTLFHASISLFLTLTCFTLLGKKITAGVAFSTLHCFITLQRAFAFSLPCAITTSAETLAACMRMNNFLILEERHTTPTKDLNEPSVNIEGASAYWTSDKTATLENITLRILPGKLCAIIGPVGSGKSSLLQVRN